MESISFFLAMAMILLSLYAFLLQLFERHFHDFYLKFQNHLQNHIEDIGGRTIFIDIYVI